MACPDIAFSLTADGRQMLGLPVGTGDLFAIMAARIGQIMGKAFTGNALTIEAERDGIRLFGHIGLPRKAGPMAAFSIFSSMDGRCRTGS